MNCTIAADTCLSSSESATYVTTSAKLYMDNCIIAGTVTGKAAKCGTNGSIRLRCSDVYGNALGTGDWVDCIASEASEDGNFCADPILCSDFGLQYNSPCLDHDTCGLVGARARSTECPASVLVNPPDKPRGDFDDIGSAVAALADGDMISLGDGTFTGSGNRNLTIAAGLTLRSDSGNPDSCIVDCQRLGRFATFSDTGIVLRNIRITHGLKADSSGGAISVTQSGSAVLENCTIDNCRSGGYSGGGAFEVGGSLRLTNCRMEYDSAGSGVGGACVVRTNRSIVVDGSLLWANQASNGAGLYLESDARANLTHCTFVRNTCGSLVGASAMCLGDRASADLDLCIVAEGTAGCLHNWEFPVKCIGEANATATCCDVWQNQGGDWVGCLEGQLDGTYNVSVNPLFCIDPGTVPVDFQLRDTSRCLTGPCGQIGAYGVCPQKKLQSGFAKDLFELVGRNPGRNPVFRFAVRAGSEQAIAILSVFDVSGRRQRVLYSGPVGTRIRTVEWDGRTDNGADLGSGIYFVRFQVDHGITRSRKLVILR